MNRTWLVGASEGIGRSLAIGLASKGYKLALSARQTDRLSNLVSQL
ncbi:MAG TPA: SDR family NAD(P)-dependent oxidoreductase, partial [Alphaproteobacteria bacterium]|nr:SDR family NAD(P)-dependent oxidoreductase [Alphaproteobacteria bacterium]